MSKRRRRKENRMEKSSKALVFNKCLSTYKCRVTLCLIFNYYAEPKVYYIEFKLVISLCNPLY